MNYVRYILKRLGQTLLVLFCVSVIAFMLIRIAPGNPARMMLPDGAPDSAVHAMEIKLGLDKPLYVQYIKYIAGVFQGDLGTSTLYRTSVSGIIAGRLPATLQLTGITTLVSLLLSIPLAMIAGTHQGKAIDFIASTFALIGQSMSTVWSGTLYILIFAVWLGLLPAMGSGGLEYLILPAITLGWPFAAQITRIGRSGIIDVLRQDYITSIRAKGISDRVIYTKYAFKNAMIPIVTIVGLNMGYMLSGAVVTEKLFAWPGIGQLIIQSVGNRDYALVQSILLVCAALFAFINLVVDVINAMIDPRITLQ